MYIHKSSVDELQELCLLHLPKNIFFFFLLETVQD